MVDSPLKPGWKIWHFDQIATSVTDRIDNPAEADVEHYVGLEHLDSDSLKIRRWGIPTDVEATKLRFRKGDIIFGRRRVYQRKVGVAEFDGICSAHALVLRPKTDVVLSEFLPFLMQSDLFMNRALEISVGSLSPTINWKTLASQEFALPPMEEQRRIARLLANQRKLLESQHEALGAIKELRLSVRQELFTSGIKNETKQSSQLGAIPSSWQVWSLSSVFEFLDNQRIPLKDGNRKQRPGIYPYYGASGPIDSIDGYIFDEPTLLLAEDGMNLVFRTSPIVYKATGKYWVNNHAHVLRPKPSTEIDFYLEYLEHISYLPYVTGTYQKKITKSDCMAIPVIFPPLEEQRQIAEYFRSIDVTTQTLIDRITATTQLGKDILGEVFP